ncbi:glycosyltransferase family protein [Pseudomonas sp. N040]|uniref:glycosyltransferase family protein n=1 Tax=Pseudomonas sp. N040 TaxID=2785325 RepID=UPI0018A27B90|nr:glycosyltransferase [Pseudomonas sp. N040]MBF7729850.1 glycosyltransferase family 1 protein [Pseudomonas sp. N040]MBW7013492.1 glycosyltransferase [Pseudomonas sp. N040]
MRVLVLTASPRLPDLCTLYGELGKHVDLHVLQLEKKQQRDLRKALRDIDLASFARVLLDLPFKNVYRQTGYLSRLNGLLIYDEDACQNYLSNSRWYGAFSQFYQRLPQARILVTGASVAARLQGEGFAVSFAPKGYDPARQYLQPGSQDLQQRDIELGFIGRTASAAYAGRKELLEQLASVEPLQLLRTEPGDAYRQMLNRIRLFVSADVGLGEYMAKNFEAMACGCVLLAWRQGSEEPAIGLQDGEHLLLYSSLAELRAHIAALRVDPQRAQRIADSGRAFVQAQLSYTHLAARMAALLAEPWPSVPPLTGWRAVWQRLRFS